MKVCCLLCFMPSASFLSCIFLVVTFNFLSFRCPCC
jgi:hypothetical protein